MYQQDMYILSTDTCVVYVLLTQHITNTYILHTRCPCASYVHVQRMYILSTHTCVVYVLLTQHITNTYILHTRCPCTSYVHVQRMYILSTSYPHLDVNMCLTQVDMSFNMFSIHRQPCMVNIVNYLSSVYNRS